MSTRVGFQMTRLSKTLLAHIAFVRFLVRVNTHVAFQITKLTKSFIADIALVRFLVRVKSDALFLKRRTLFGQSSKGEDLLNPNFYPWKQNAFFVRVFLSSLLFPVELHEEGNTREKGVKNERRRVLRTSSLRRRRRRRSGIKRRRHFFAVLHREEVLQRRRDFCDTLEEEKTKTRHRHVVLSHCARFCHTTRVESERRRRREDDFTER